MVQPALQAAEALDATVADMRFVKPLDEALILQLAQSHDYLVCIEENATMGGAGSAVLETLAQQRIYLPVLLMGIPDIVTEHGDAHLLLEHLHLSASALQHKNQRMAIPTDRVSPRSPMTAITANQVYRLLDAYLQKLTMPCPTQP